MTINLKKPLVYVARDIERALGMKPEGTYYVVSNDTPFGRQSQKWSPNNIILVQSRKILDTDDLLLRKETIDLITSLKADVVVFMSTPRTERIAEENGWNLVNPPAALARKVEEKISQIKWLAEDAKLLPPHKISAVKDVTFTGEKFVLQFNHSHTGEGTFIIDNEKVLTYLKKKFPERECRTVQFIEGPIFTINSVVAKDKIVVGNPSYQITGLSPYTDLPFSTIGNDWSLPHNPKYTGAYEETKKLAEKVGTRLKKDGWKGLFGIDVVFDLKTRKTFLLEVNARQPASSVFESWLQKTDTIFEAHIKSLLDIQVQRAKEINAGAQIVKRMTETNYTVDVTTLKGKGLEVMRYENTDHNKELFRIQTSMGIMKDHNSFNDLGELITSCIR
jgi:glutathione synthase/RimK-type ligase-like ATP-grasp enzyme